MDAPKIAKNDRTVLCGTEAKSSAVFNRSVARFLTCRTAKIREFVPVGVIPRSLPGEAQDEAAVRFALTRHASPVTLSMRTEAGTARFDNSLARRIVAAFEQGPRSSRQLKEPASDVVANALTLACAGTIQPVNASDTPVSVFNAALAAVDTEAVPLPFRAMPYGIVLVLEPLLRRYPRGSGRLPRRLRACPDPLLRATGAEE